MGFKVLVLGGCGFIGRHFVSYLYNNKLAEHIRVIDKVIPEMSFMTEEHSQMFEKIDFVQHNLLVPVDDLFRLPSGEAFDFAFNAAGETKVGLDDDLYKEGIVQLSKKIGDLCAKNEVGKLIELSTGMVYSSNNKLKNESSKVDPWTKIAKCKLEVEEFLTKHPNLKDVVILRTSIVYGDGDRHGLAPRIVTGAVYKHLQKKMKFLYTGELMINTVHVEDVCRAMWLAATKGKTKALYNLSDQNFTDQQKFNSILEKVFGIETGYASKITSQLSKMVSLEHITDEVNDRHLIPWLEICKKNGVGSTPVSPYLSPDFLGNNHLHVDGSLIEKELGFKYEHPKITEDSIRSWIKYFRAQNAFPDGFTT